MTLALEGVGYVRDPIHEERSIKVKWRREPRRRWARVSPANKNAPVSRLKPRWLWAIFVDRDCRVPITKADEPNENGLWWAADGKLLRVATNAEIVAYAGKKLVGPGDGWELVDGATFVDGRRERVAPVETPEDRERERVAAVLARQDERIAAAEKYFERAKRDVERAQRRADLWWKKLRDARRAKERYTKGGSP